ncbi:hypothetical protein MTR_4g043560 [Medicago truncatula]|uniref:Uncharacterized protein n=1 Tax=Medicago truncatula TaxID=3880 RepID=G7JUQ8_MEDTR|nr:hypothetical protein MTR_4g043560 [Medicago truncatula]
MANSHLELKRKLESVCDVACDEWILILTCTVNAPFIGCQVCLRPNERGTPVIGLKDLAAKRKK